VSPARGPVAFDTRQEDREDEGFGEEDRLQRTQSSNQSSKHSNREDRELGDGVQRTKSKNLRDGARRLPSRAASSSENARSSSHETHGGTPITPATTRYWGLENEVVTPTTPATSRFWGL